ncbi:MAG: hypothetical protein IH969_09745, partial [Candidatus Krumholzibacteriota bacterium]|nr:hypothetical protein [Candidatus Krumholzibacteriota bacterium]
MFGELWWNADALTITEAVETATGEGRLDDLKVQGTLSGTGVGVAVSGLAFNGRIDSKEIDLDRLTGQVFGCRVDGAFRLRIDGPGDLFYQGHVEGLDLTDGFLPDKGLPVTDITGDLTLDHDATAHTWDFRGTVGPSTVDGYEIRSGEVSGVYTDGSGLVVRRARLIRPGYEMDATGFVEEEGGVFDMVMSVEAHDLTYFWDYFDLPHVDVKVSGTARLTGPPEDMRINLNGDVRDVGFLFAGIDSGVVNAELLGIGSTNPSARIDITGRHARIRDAVFDNPHVYIEVEEDRVHIRDITVSRGDTTFSVGFDVDGNEDTTIVYVLRGSIRSPYETWGLAAPTTIRHEMGDVHIDSLVFVSPGGEVGFAGSYWKSRDTVAFDAWGTNVDLEVLRRALALPFPLSGRATFNISADGDAQNPRVELFVDASGGVIDSTAFDVFRASASFDGRAYYLEELMLITQNDSISARGRWNYVDSPLRIMRAGIDPRARDAAFELDLSAQHYPLATVLRALHQPVWVGGAFGGTVAFRGSPGAPELTVHGSVQRRVGPGVTLPDTVHVDVRYADGILRVNDLHIAGDLDVTATGSLALNLSLFDGLEVSSDAAVRATLDVGESDLSGLRAYIPGLAVLGGFMEGEISVKGTLARPEFAGALAIRGGLVRFDELAESYRDVNARIDFVGSTMRLSSFSARSGDKGAIYASGAMELAGFKAREYHVDVSLTDFRLKSIPDFESVQNGTLRISSLEWSDGRVIPSFDGSFIVQEARLYWVFDATGATQAQITMPTDEPGWVCSIDLSADNNIWVRNQ